MVQPRRPRQSKAATPAMNCSTGLQDQLSVVRGQPCIDFIQGRVDAGGVLERIFRTDERPRSKRDRAADSQKGKQTNSKEWDQYNGPLRITTVSPVAKDIRTLVKLAERWGQTN